MHTEKSLDFFLPSFKEKGKYVNKTYLNKWHLSILFVALETVCEVILCLNYAKGKIKSDNVWSFG